MKARNLEARGGWVMSATMRILVLAWDKERGEPSVKGGFTPEKERALVGQ